jgi:hypothetical protein
VKEPASLDRQACKREAGNLHQTLGFDMNLEFQGSEMLFAVAVTEESQDLIGAGSHWKLTRPRSDESPEHGKVRCWLMSSQIRHLASCAMPYRVQKRPLSSSRSE